MSEDNLTTLDRLLAQWEELGQSGIDASPEELCTSIGRADLASELAARILKLKAMKPWGKAFQAASPKELSGHADDLLEADLPKAIGEFRVIQKLGSGGIGVVYLAEQVSPKRLVAVKVLRSSHSPDSARVKRLLQEANILAVLDHQGIAQIFASGEAAIVTHRGIGDEVTFICMEYVPGTNPAVYLQGKSSDEAVQLVIQILDAVSHAHQKGVIHRDIKPSNVLVNERGIPKLLDFGIAKLVDPGNETLTSGESFLGSFNCVSPEQLSNPRSADSRSDVYSVAAMAYELLTGKSAIDFEHHTFQSACKAIECTTPPLMSIHQPELAGDLETIISKGLRKDPADRYQSASEFMDDLRRYSNGEVVMARSVSASERIFKWASRNRVLATIYSASIATILITSVVSVYWAKTASQRATELASANRLADARLEKLGRSNFNMSLLTAAGNLPLDPQAALKLLNNEEQCPPTLTDFAWELLHQCASNTIVMDKESEQNVSAVRFSEVAGEARLYVGFEDGRFVSFNVETMKTMLEARPVSWPISKIACSTKGDIVALGAASGELSVIEPATGSCQSLDVSEAKGGLRCLAHSESLGGFLMAYGNGDVFIAASPAYRLERKHATRLAVRHADFFDEDNVLFFSTEDQGLAFIDVASGEVIHAKDRVPRRATAIAFLNNGQAIEFGHNGSSYRWDKDTGKLISSFAAFPVPINRFAKSPSGVEVAFGAREVFVLNSDLEALKYRELRVPRRLRKPSIDVSPTGKWIALGKKRLTLWDMRPLAASEVWQTASQDVHLELLDESADSFCYVDGSELVVIRADKPVSRMKFARDDGLCIAVGIDQQLVAIGCRDGMIYVVDIRVNRIISSLPCDGKIPTELAFWDEDRKLIAGYDNGEIEIRDLSTGKVVDAIRLGRRPIRPIEFSPDGTTLIAVGKAQIASYDLLNRRFNWKAGIHDIVNGLVISPDGQSLFTAYRSGVIRKWDVSSGSLAAPLVEGGEPLTALTISLDGSTLGTTNFSGALDLWDAKTGAHRMRLDAHASKATHVAFAPNGKALISAARDKRICVWRLGDGDGDGEGLREDVGVNKADGGEKDR